MVGSPGARGLPTLLALIFSATCYARDRFRCVTKEQEAAAAHCEAPCEWAPIEFNKQEPACLILQSKILQIQHITGGSRGSLSDAFARTAESIEMMVSDIEVEGVVGDIMETGVYTGRHSMVLAASLVAHGAFDRKQYLCDSFDGIPLPDPSRFIGDEDEVRKANIPSRTRLHLGGPHQTMRNFKAASLFGQGLTQHWIVGFFNETMPSLWRGVDQLAILRLDGDIFQSTWEVLVTMYGKVSIGGYVIIDDYHIPACVRAVTMFRTRYGSTEPILTVRTSNMHLPKTGAYWKKTKEVLVPKEDVYRSFFEGSGFLFT